jgi:hypothetical protein
MLGPAAPPAHSRRRLRRDVLVACALTAGTAAICASLLAVALLVPAPAPVLPLVAVVALGCPMFAVWELARRLGPCDEADGGAEPRLDAEALHELRRALARLPETRHPLGL